MDWAAESLQNLISRLVEGMIPGGLYKLKTRAPFLSNNPPPLTSLFSTICGAPGSHERCSTASLRSSQVPAAIGFLSPDTGTGGTRELTAVAVHPSPVGRWM